jgi:SAM-dependent methyltransferase
VSEVGAGEQATGFGAASDDYDRFRPRPAPEALDWLLRPGDRDVLDVGAGTGQLTALLVDRVAVVTALEPDARMRRELSLRVPGARTVDGVAERLPVADASQDAVLSHAAWHWFDPSRAVAEAARVLRPGGRLGVLQTGFDPDVEWLGELWDRLEPDPSARRPGGRPRRVRLAADRIAQLRVARSFGRVRAPFDAREAHIVRFGRRFSADELVGLAGTYSGLVVKPPAERAARLEELRELIETHPLLGGRDDLEVPMLTRCWRAGRRG